jgi:hypothetical protein
MFRGSLVPLALAALLATAAPATAQRDVFLSYTSLGLGLSTRTNAIDSDSANRVWFATNTGVAAVIGEGVNISLNQNDFEGATAFVIDVTFGILEDGENFFFGFANRIEFGRVLEDGRISYNAASPLAIPEGLRSLASDGDTSLWVATNEGLLEFRLGGGVPELQNQVFLEDDPVDPVEVAPWVQGTVDDPIPDPTAVFFSETEDRLFLARSGDQLATRLQNPNLSLVAGFDFEPDALLDLEDGDLWVAGTRGQQSQVLVRYSGEGLKGATPGDVLPVSFSFNVANRTLNDIAVDPFTDTLWVATDRGPYFQTPDDQGNIGTDDCTGQADSCVGWRLASESSATADFIDTVFADPSGNIWFGTNRGASGFIHV